MLDIVTITLQVATPVWLAALGGMYAHRAGVMHLGLEGLMVLGAFASVAILLHNGSLLVALLVAAVTDVAVSVLFWVLITYFGTNIMITGLALSMVALAGTSFALVAVFGSSATITTSHGLPRPVEHAHGPLSVLNGLSLLTYVALAVSAVSWWILRRTRFGLRLHAAGNDPFAAASAGVHVARTRLHALMIAGVFSAMAGADLALGAIHAFHENMTQGRGYLAFAAVLLGRASPAGVAAAALFFGLASALGIRSQLSSTNAIPVQLVLILPYAVTIVAMCVSAPHLAGVLRNARARLQRGGHDTSSREP
ncbi:ABC transporter permease [Streptomyces spiralis]|uniref:ABC transporter permease n=1 Tax=Streptomyces spiralis TaxID=66376 RepID=UPI003687B473